MIVRLGGIPSVLNIFSNRYDDAVIVPLLNILMADNELYSDDEAIG